MKQKTRRSGFCVKVISESIYSAIHASFELAPEIKIRGEVRPLHHVNANEPLFGVDKEKRPVNATPMIVAN
jgi:hypothetical protein